jgi:hypothetical protein
VGVVVRDRGEEATFVFKEIAHPRPTGEHKLSHILDDLGLLLGRESGEPLGETYFALAGQENKVADGHCDEVLGSGKGMAKREVGAVKAVADPSFWRNSSSGAEGRCPATEP